MILGSGPNRIGQGIEFDYACVHAAFALEEAGFESVMVNSNPETVSTDYDTSSRLYFEPVTAEDVLAVCHAERPVGVIVQFGGQTPLKLARTLEEEGFPVLGTAPEAIDLAEDRGKFAQVLAELDIAAPPHGEARTLPEARAIAAQIGFPVVVRPSYVLGGRAMEIVYDADDLETFVRTAAEASPDHPVLIDRFLEGAIEVDVDAVCDGSDVFIGAVMEHIEEAGVHSGDSSCQIPPATLSDDELDEIEDITRRLARRLGVLGRAEPAAGGEGRTDLGAGGEPARVPHGAVRLEGDRGVAGADRHAGAHGAVAGGAGGRGRAARPIRITTGTSRTRR